MQMRLRTSRKRVRIRHPDQATYDLRLSRRYSAPARRPGRGVPGVAGVSAMTAFAAASWAAIAVGLGGLLALIRALYLQCGRGRRAAAALAPPPPSHP